MRCLSFGAYEGFKLAEKNAARLLYELFMKWYGEDGSFAQSNIRENGESQWLVESRLAIKYLEEIQLFIDREGEDAPAMKHIKQVLPRYWNWVFAKSQGWSRPSSEFITPFEIYYLDGFDSKDMHQVGQPILETADLLLQNLPQLVREVDEDESLAPALKKYIKTVLIHAQKVLSVDSDSTAFDKQRALNELASMLGVGAKMTSNPEKSERWKKLGDLALTTFVSSFVAASATGLYTLAIEEGPGTIYELSSNFVSSVDFDDDSVPSDSESARQEQENADTTSATSEEDEETK